MKVSKSCESYSFKTLEIRHFNPLLYVCVNACNQSPERHTHVETRNKLVLLLTSVKTPAIPAWHEPCSSPQVFLWSARVSRGRERKRKEKKKQQTTNDFAVSLSQHLLELFRHSIWSQSKSQLHPTGIWGPTDRLRTNEQQQKTHTPEGFEKRGDCCVCLWLQKILGLDLPIMHTHTHTEGPQCQLTGVWKRYGRK